MSDAVKVFVDTYANHLYMYYSDLASRDLDAVFDTLERNKPKYDPEDNQCHFEDMYCASRFKAAKKVLQDV